ncbi:hypothetical protein [Nocardia sp. X0981]
MTIEAAGNFLVGLAERLTPSCDPTLIRTGLTCASGGQLAGRGPDGYRASTLTISGVPFEASVTGGSGTFTPVIRYVTEAGSQEKEFSPRMTAQLAAIQKLTAMLPDDGGRLSDMFTSFVTTLYPEPTKIPARHRFVTWVGVSHHASAPRHPAGLKVYGNPRGGPEGLRKLCSEIPGFEGLTLTREAEQLIMPAGVGLESDAAGKIGHKVYFKTRYKDVAVPMKLVRYFGEPAWALLSELVSCGVDAARIHQHNLFVCRTREALTLYMVARPGEDLTGLVGTLATRHHGTTHAVEALAAAAQSSGAAWHYSGIGLRFSTAHGIDKLNVYCTPTWERDSTE